MMISNAEDKVMWRDAARLFTNADGTYNHKRVVELMHRRRLDFLRAKLQEKHRRQIIKNDI